MMTVSALSTRTSSWGWNSASVAPRSMASATAAAGRGDASAGQRLGLHGPLSRARFDPQCAGLVAQATSQAAHAVLAAREWRCGQFIPCGSYVGDISFCTSINISNANY